MGMIRIRFNSVDIKKIEASIPSNEIPTVAFSSERYIDYTNFKDGYIMTYDEERNRYYFENPDNVINKTTTEPPYPENFTEKLTDEVEESIDIDMGEY